MMRALTIFLTAFMACAAAHAQYVSGIGTGVPVGCGQLPALTGDVTTTAGACPTTVTKIQGTVVSGTTGTGSVAFGAAPAFTAPTISPASGATNAMAFNYAAPPYYGWSFNGVSYGSGFVGPIWDTSGADPSIYWTVGGGGTNVFVVQNNSGAKAISVSGTGVILMPELANAAGNEILCYATANGNVTYENAVAGCVPSALRFKNPIGTVPGDPALDLAVLRPAVWTYKDTADFGAQRTVGLYADDVRKMDPRCVVYDKAGRLENYEDRCVIAHLVADMQVQQRRIDELTAERSGGVFAPLWHRIETWWGENGR